MMDELRIEIWDLLYLATTPISENEIAESLGTDIAVIQAAVDHEWFTAKDSSISISMGAGSCADET